MMRKKERRNCTSMVRLAWIATIDSRADAPCIFRRIALESKGREHSSGDLPEPRVSRG